MNYRIQLIGCDDTTEFTMKLTKGQAELVSTISQKSKKASEYGCQPTLRIEVICPVTDTEVT